MKILDRVKQAGAAFQAFQKGKRVFNRKAWAAGQVTANVIALFIADLVDLGCAVGEAYCLPIGGEGIDAVSAGLVVIVNLVFGLVYSDRVGVPARRKPNH